MSTAFHDLKKFFNANNVAYRTWSLRKQEEQEYDGDIIVIGGEGDDPYTQFCFNDEGQMVSASCCIDHNTENKQVIVENVGGVTYTEYDYDTEQTTTITEER